MDGILNNRNINTGCPLIDNPIQIISMHKYKEVREKINNYYDYISIAKYSEINHTNCPFVNPYSDYNDEIIRPQKQNEMVLYQTMRDHYDKIIDILQKSLGINISLRFARTLLQNWAANEGWRYYGSTYANLPQMLIFAEMSQTMFGRIIVKNGDIHKALIRYGTNIDFEECDDGKSVKISEKPGKFLDCNFFVYNHKTKQERQQVIETFQLSINEDDKEIFSKTLLVDQSYLWNLIHTDHEPTKRDKALLEIAKEIL